METRKTAAERGTVTVLIAVANAHRRRFRRGVDRFAPRVRSLEIEIVAETLGPFELHRVVVTPRRIRNREIGPVETIRPALVCARHAEAVFVRGNRNDHRTQCSKRNRSGAGGAGAMDIGRRSDDLAAQASIVRMVGNANAVDRIVHREVVERILQQPDAAIAGVAHAERGSKWHLSFDR